MEIGAVVAAVAAALGSLGSIARAYQRRSNRVRAEIAANHDLASKYPEGSPERTALEGYGRLLIDDYVRNGIAKARSPRHWTWGSLVTASIAAVGFGYGALLVQAQWAQVVLWTFAGLMVISIFGQITGPGTPKQKKSGQVAGTDGQELSQPAE